MADIYLSSVDGSDASDGSTWADAKATLAAALTAAGAGGRVFVDPAHAESQGTIMALASPGTQASPVQVLCVDRTGDPEPPTALSTGATVATGTGNNAMNLSGVAYSYGVSYRCGVGSSSGGSTLTVCSGLTADDGWVIENGLLEINSSSSSAFIALGPVAISGGARRGPKVELINTPLKFAAVGHTVRPGNCLWRSTPSGIQGTVPTTLFVPTVNLHGVRVDVRGVDLSAATSGKNLIDVSVVGQQDYRLENCKLGSDVAITTGSVASPGGAVVELVDCDSADTNYRYCKKNYQGEITHETTIVRTGGASDGTTPISRKMVSSANSKFYSPLVSGPIGYWNETTGSAVTATVEVVTDNVTLTDAEAWIEVEYLGTSGFPLSLFANDRAADILATPANQTSSSETWTTTGLTTPVKQALSVSFTPQEKGVVLIRVHLAKASTTMYFCPKADIS